jgi:DnaJ-class molecular chaperone
MARNYYDVLEVKRTASRNEIKAAYRRLAVKWHPDRCDRPDATARIQEINAAYECLKDPLRRRMYDETLRRHGNERKWEAPPHEERARQAPPEEEPRPFADWGDIVILRPETLLAVFTRIDDVFRHVFRKQRQA